MNTAMANSDWPGVVPSTALNFKAPEERLRLLLRSLPEKSLRCPMERAGLRSRCFKIQLLVRKIVFLQADGHETDYPEDPSEVGLVMELSTLATADLSALPSLTRIWRRAHLLEAMLVQ